MKYAKIVLSLGFIGCSDFISAMDGKDQLTSPLTVARTMSSCEEINQGVLLMPKVLRNRNVAEESQLLQKMYPRIEHKYEELGVLLMPKVLKDRLFFEQDLHRRHAAGASEQELSSMVDDFKTKQYQYDVQIMKIAAQYQKDTNQKQDSTNCCSLISNCFGIK